MISQLERNHVCPDYYNYGEGIMCGEAFVKPLVHAETGDLAVLKQNIYSLEYIV